MPQMMTLNWMFLMLFFIMIFFMFDIFIYSNFIEMNSSLKVNYTSASVCKYNSRYAHDL